MPSDQEAKLAILGDIRDLFHVCPEPGARMSLEDAPTQIQAQNFFEELKARVGN